MIKLFVTGDVHIGKKYDGYSDIKDTLIQSRFNCLDRAVKQAEKEACDYFVITGDLFERINAIKVGDVKKVVDILAAFNGSVVVLPGNHDFYSDEAKVWKDFRAHMAKTDHNITLITEFKEYTFETDDETITFYPAFCDSKHSESNNLGWIKQSAMDDSTYHVGIAHGTIEGVAQDDEGKYFVMSEKELKSIPVDAWLIGHTHTPYPGDLPLEGEIEGYQIFNAGTPAQIAVNNNTEGYCFIVSLEKEQDKTIVSAHRYKSGEIRFFDIDAKASEGSLESVIKTATENLPDESVIRLTVSGTVDAEDYQDRQNIYKDALDRFIAVYEEDSTLCERITDEKIRAEFAETGFAAEFLLSIKDPQELKMAYDLIKRHQE